MKQQNMTTTEYLLTQKHLVHSALPPMEKILQKINKSKNISLVYGETYDQYGQTVDSLKYYFFLALLKQALKQKGLNISATVIIGDLHAVKNKLVQNREELLSDAASRVRFIEKLNGIYGLELSPILMSEMCKTDEFQNRLHKIHPIFQSSPELKKIAKKTVLQNRINQEEKVEFAYTVEEVALILGFDIKIGPPREIHYDTIARSLGTHVSNKDFTGLYLQPTYPLGLGFNFFVNNPEIEEYGVTPYKAGSNRLQNNRIILGSTTSAQVQQLIQQSFISSNVELPNPVMDIYLIAQMAGCLLRKEPFIFDENISRDLGHLKDVTYKELITNIYQPLEIQA